MNNSGVKKILFLLTLFFLVGIIGVVNEATTNQPSYKYDHGKNSPLTSSGDLVMEADLINTNNPIVIGRTSLPDNTNLVIGLSKTTGKHHCGRAEVMVKNGLFETATILDCAQHEKLEPGIYDIHISVPPLEVGNLPSEILTSNSPFIDRSLGFPFLYYTKKTKLGSNRQN